MPENLMIQHRLLPLVHLLHRFEHSHRISVLIPGPDQCLNILRETGAPVTATCIQKLLAYAGIASDALFHRLHVGSHQFAKIGDIVHKRNPGGQHRISRIFGHLGRRDIHK